MAHYIHASRRENNVSAVNGADSSGGEELAHGSHVSSADPPSCVPALGTRCHRYQDIKRLGDPQTESSRRSDAASGIIEAGPLLC